MPKIPIPEDLMGSGVLMALYRQLYLWWTAKKPPMTSSVMEKLIYSLKWLLGYYFYTKIGPAYHRFITKITAYYPFSLLYQGRLIHADNIKARDLMRGMETIASSAGIPVCINTGQWERCFSVFYGKLERGEINKEQAVKKMQQLFQDKFGTIYVQAQRTGFRVLVGNNLLED